MKQLTNPQLEILRFIYQYQEKHGKSSTRQEIAGSFKCSKTSTNDHLKRRKKPGSNSPYMSPVQYILPSAETVRPILPHRDKETPYTKWL
ncbi:LexA family protein [Thermodesulfobacteriota bacterium]